MRSYHGACHCGAIHFEFSGPEIVSGLRCNCSMCRRRGTIMTAFTVAKADVEIDNSKQTLRCYEFQSKVAKHYFCAVCGIYPFHQTKRKPGQYRFNLGCIELIDAYSLPTEIFDGAAL